MQLILVNGEGEPEPNDAKIQDMVKDRTTIEEKYKKYASEEYGPECIKAAQALIPPGASDADREERIKIRMIAFMFLAI